MRGSDRSDLHLTGKPGCKAEGEKWHGPGLGPTDFKWVKQPADPGKEVTAGNSNVLRSPGFLGSKPQTVFMYTRTTP